VLPQSVLLQSVLLQSVLPQSVLLQSVLLQSVLLQSVLLQSVLLQSVLLQSVLRPSMSLHRPTHKWLRNDSWHKIKHVTSNANLYRQPHSQYQQAQALTATTIMTQIPYVIDNIHHTLADVLNDLIHRQHSPQVDIATAYFSIRGFELLGEALAGARRIRLLLGDEPQHASDVGVRADAPTWLRHELNAEPLSETTQRLVEALVRFLRREDVEVRLYRGHPPDQNGPRRFLHAKCYLVYGGRGAQPALFDHLNPLAGIVGSSNFTAPGLVGNRELNLVHKTHLATDEVEDEIARSEVAHHAQTQVNQRISAENQRLLKSEVGARAILDLAAWYEEQWQLAVDFKPQLINLVENSKFGGREYTPYEIYLKALYEYFRDDLGNEAQPAAIRSAVELTEFQEDAVKKARRILARYDGVLVADSVGLGKTWIGKKLLEDTAYHQRQKALVICPASLRALWEHELQSATIAATVLSQERLGQDGFDLHPLADVDLILVDEAHNFRNRHTKRYQTLETLLAANGRRGRSGGRKKMILLTATPINNNIFDLYNQINLFTGNDRTYFAAAGIGDLYQYFLVARRESVEQGTIRIFNLLEEVVIRRTRQFIRRAYPEATIAGKRVTWPERRLSTVRYDLDAAYEGLYTEIVRRIERLNLAHYNLEAYKATDVEQDEFELGRQEALVGIFKSRFLKRLESSVAAFRISTRRALEFVKTFDEYVQDDIVLDAASFQLALRLLGPDAADDEDGLPSSLAGAIDAGVAAREVIETLPKLDARRYNRRRLHQALTADIDNLTAIWYLIQHSTALRDVKLEQLKMLLQSELAGKKVLVFSYYRDTARYLYEALTSPANAAWRAAMAEPTIRRIDGDVAPADRVRLVELFAPAANARTDLQGTAEEIDILIATDVLSEGQNLQDCGHLVNYDLHWNPTRMVQRAGRVDRLGSPYELLTIYNMFPEKELEELLGLVARLTTKIDMINQTGFLDASVLGEVVTPRDFNTLRRIADADSRVLEEQESFLELASSEVMLAELQRILATQAGQWITDLDHGIHSSIQQPRARGVFFYFTAPHPEQGKLHFWRYFDLTRREIIDNRYQIMQLIACGPETPRHPPPYDDMNIFQIQERIIDSIITGVEQQQASSLIAKPTTEEQNIVANILREQARNPALDRSELRTLRQFLKQPLVGATIQQLRTGLKQYASDNNFANLLDLLRTLYTQQGGPAMAMAAARPRSHLRREDLQLVCYEYIDS
jgi:SNF2 family DNA or RNA helicase